MDWTLNEIVGMDAINTALQQFSQHPACPHRHMAVNEEGVARLITLTEGEECLGFALLADHEQYAYQQIFEDPTVGGFDLSLPKGREHYQWFINEYLPRFEQGCTIIWMSSLARGRGVGRYLAQQIKSAYPAVLLYSVAESTQFWEKQRFEPVSDSYVYGFEWGY